MNKKVPVAELGADEQRLSFFPAWCKRCGNCASFCPRGALAMDEWGHPYLKQPERCTRCGLCEMLCPDFAIGVEESAVTEIPADTPSPGSPGSPVSPRHSPERLAPVPLPPSSREKKRG